MSPYLTVDEVADICRPLKQHAAQIRYLKTVLKLPVERRPDGSPLVKRSDVEQRVQNRCQTNGPRWSVAS